MKMNMYQKCLKMKRISRKMCLEILKPFGSQRRSGMTLMEIIIVVALLGTLMTILVRTLTSQQDEAMKDQAKLGMATIQQSMQMYRIHNRKFPENLDDLVTNVSNSPNWRGPYIEPEKIKDPWSNQYQLEVNGNVVKLTSAGQDGQLGTSDDVVYPEESKAAESEQK